MCVIYTPQTRLLAQSERKRFFGVLMQRRFLARGSFRSAAELLGPAQLQRFLEDSNAR